MKKAALALTLVLSAAPGAWAQGTSLSLVLLDEDVSCQGIEAANVSVGYVFSSTAASQTTVTRTLRDTNLSADAPAVASTGYTIPSGPSVGGWIFTGNTRTHEGMVQYPSLPNGRYELEVCGTQPGSGGNPDKTVCETKRIVIDCEEAQVNPCANTGPFGAVVGNTQIRANATAQIQFRGNLGPTALVEVTKDGFKESAWIDRAGESCNYHANWKFNNESGADLIGNAGAGVYTVNVTGSNGNVVPEFSVTLTEPKGNK